MMKFPETNIKKPWNKEPTCLNFCEVIMGAENVLDASIVLWISSSCSAQGVQGSWVYFHSMDLCFVLGSNC